jgi:hypothetical protein
MLTLLPGALSDAGSLVRRGASHIAHRLHYYFLYFPLEELYRRWYWRNARAEDICASISGLRTGAQFWTHDEFTRDECLRVMSQHFDGWLAVAEVGVFYGSMAVAGYMIYRTAVGCCRCYFLGQPNNSVKHGRTKKCLRRRRPPTLPSPPPPS